MRLHLAVIVTAAALGLFGCAAMPDEARDAKRWTATLVDAVKPLPHADRLVDVTYTVQGTMARDQVWLSGAVWSDTTDADANLKLLDDLGRAVATSFADNPAPKSWVRIHVVAQDGSTTYRLDRLGLPAEPTLDDLASHYQIPRR